MTLTEYLREPMTGHAAERTAWPSREVVASPSALSDSVRVIKNQGEPATHSVLAASTAAGWLDPSLRAGRAVDGFLERTQLRDQYGHGVISLRKATEVVRDSLRRRAAEDGHRRCRVIG